MNRLIEFLGICRKAGALTYGAAETQTAMKQGKAVCVLIMSDTSSKTEKEIHYANRDKISVLHLNHTKEETKQVLKSACGIIGITDENLAKKVISLADGETKEE